MITFEQYNKLCIQLLGGPIEETESEIEGKKSYLIANYQIDETDREIYTKDDFSQTREMPTGRYYWTVGVWETDYGDRDTPPSNDLRILKRGIESFGDAVKKVIMLCFENQLENELQNLYEISLAKEEAKWQNESQEYSRIEKNHYGRRENY